MADNQQTKSETQDTNWTYNAPESAENYDGTDIGQSAGVPLPKIPEVKWSASEYVAHEKSASWYFALFSICLLLVVAVFVITGDYLATFVVLLASVALSVLAGRKPATKNYSIDETGVRIDDASYPYSALRSFSVVEEGGIDSVWLKPLKRFTPPIVMYFSPADEQKIVDVLANFLPHERRELDPIDRFSKRIRF